MTNNNDHAKEFLTGEAESIGLPDLQPDDLDLEGRGIELAVRFRESTAACASSASGEACEETTVKLEKATIDVPSGFPHGATPRLAVPASPLGWRTFGYYYARCRMNSAIAFPLSLGSERGRGYVSTAAPADYVAQSGVEA